MKDDKTTKERIMDEASALFAKNGFGGTSVRDICKAADVNVASISYHFGCKEKLFYAVVESFTSDSIEGMKQLLKPVATYGECMLVLRHAAETHLEQLLSQKNLVRTVITAAESGDPFVREIFIRTIKAWNERLTTWIVACQRNGIINPDVDAAILMDMLFHFLSSLVRTGEIICEIKGFHLEKPEDRQRFLDRTMSVVGAALQSKEI